MDLDSKKMIAEYGLHIFVERKIEMLKRFWTKSNFLCVLIYKGSLLSAC